MNITNLIPPNPQHVVLKRIYPWDKYDISLVMSWLYEQALQSGFTGTFNDFKLRYGEYVQSLDLSQLYDLLDCYDGDYHVIPMLGTQQVLETKDKLMTGNIVVDPVPADLFPPDYEGGYNITPLAYVQQILRTANKALKEDVVIEEIPYYETSNAAGGYTAIIG